MKKIIKKIGACLVGILGLVLVMIAVLAIRNQLLMNKESALYEGSYGQMIEIDGREMCVEVSGGGDETIVLTPGLGSTSPVLEMRGLVDKLKVKYTVVVIEPFGYGLSDPTDKERTIENITEEMHAALSKLGCTQYWMMGHSISGVYNLYYANQYPDEVSGYISIDGSVPKQMLAEDTESSLGQYELLSLMNKSGIYRFLANIDSQGVVPTIKDYVFNDEEKCIYEALVFKNFMNKDTLDEFKHANANFSKAIELHFPEKMPVLTFLSKENCELTPNWQVLHEEIVTKKTTGQVVVLNGGHYLQYEYPEEMVQQFETWRRENNI